MAVQRPSLEDVKPRSLAQLFPRHKEHIFQWRLAPKTNHCKPASVPWNTPGLLPTVVGPLQVEW